MHFLERLHFGFCEAVWCNCRSGPRFDTGGMMKAPTAASQPPFVNPGPLKLETKKVSMCGGLFFFFLPRVSSFFL
jgi:hypothetical protein